ncbi:MAG: acylphosphatase [Microscillaceae bacterium]
MRIGGLVQGVGYRAFVLDKAQRLGLSGYVQNEPDGTVYLEAWGEHQAIEQLRIFCLQGPPLAQVNLLETELLDTIPENIQGFEIRY